MTNTAIFADVVLPAASSVETSDIFIAYGHCCMQRAYPAIPPVGEAKSNGDVFSASEG